MRDTDLNQRVFRTGVKRLVKSINHEVQTLFNRLDPGLKPQVFVLGLPFAGGAPAFVEPDPNPLIVDWFHNAQDVVQEVREDDLTDLAHDVQGMIWQQRVDIKRAIQSVLDEKCSKSGWVAFTHFPQFLQGYSVSLLLYVSQSALDSHYHLSKGSQWGYPATSLLYETIVAFLYSSESALEKLAHGRAGFALIEQGDVTLRRAAYWLMNSIQRRASGQGSVDLFNAFNIISSLSYEGEKSTGKLILSDMTHPNTTTKVGLQEPVRLSEFNRVRKLLEITSSGLDLLCDGSNVYGFGTVDISSYDETREDLFVVKFVGHYSWQLLHNNVELMVVNYQAPALPDPAVKKADFSAQAQKELVNISDDDLLLLWELSLEAAEQHHGTMLVVSDHAAEEAQRLQSQATVIEPLKLTKELIMPLSSIDGAILITEKSVCHAIGVILDGIAVEGRGDPSRGARYNSAIRYAEYMRQQGNTCFIIVISEDGIINLM